MNEDSYRVIGEDGRELGPVTKKDLLSLLFSKEIAPNAMVRSVSSNRWTRLDELSALTALTEPTEAITSRPISVASTQQVTLPPMNLEPRSPTPQPIATVVEISPPQVQKPKGKTHKEPINWVDLAIPIIPQFLFYFFGAMWKSLDRLEGAAFIGGACGQIIYIFFPVFVFLLLRKKFERAKSAIGCFSIVFLVMLIALGITIFLSRT